ncbi:MAG: hypothetical protein Q7S52_04600 [bacterium]|nr:hypothetical protein [bacterium]
MKRSKWFAVTALVAAVMFGTSVFAQETALFGPSPISGTAAEEPILPIPAPTLTQDGTSVDDPLGIGNNVELTVTEKREPAPHLHLGGWGKNKEFVIGGGASSSSTWDGNFEFVEFVPQYWRVQDGGRAGLHMSVRRWSGKGSSGYEGNTKPSFGIGISGVTESFGMYSDTQTSGWLELQQENEEGSNPTTPFKYEMERTTRYLAGYGEQRIFYPRELVPEVDLFVAGRIDLSRSKSSSVLDTGPRNPNRKRLPVMSGDPAKPKGEVRVGVIADIAHFGSGFKDLTPALGVQYSRAQENGEASVDVIMRLGLAQKHVYLIVQQSNGLGGALDKTVVSLQFSAWDF